MITFPKRPQASDVALYKQKSISLRTNYYRFEFDNKCREVQKYNVKFTPELPDASKTVRCKVVHQVKEMLLEKLGFYIFLGQHIYALKMDTELPVFESTWDSVDYKVEVHWV